MRSGIDIHLSEIEIEELQKALAVRVAEVKKVLTRVPKSDLLHRRYCEQCIEVCENLHKTLDKHP